MIMRFFTTSSRPAYFFGLFLLLTLGGCGSDSSSSSITTTPITTVSASLDSSVKNVQLRTGVPTEIKFTYTVPGDITAKGDFFINVSRTLENISLTSSPVASGSSRFETLRLLAYALVKDAFAATESTAQITAYISYAGDPEVCSSPYRFGPYSVSGMIDSALSSDTTSVTPTQPSIDISNAGSFEVCVVTIPPIDAYLTATGVVVDFEPCAKPTVDIVGNWSGTYQCTNFGVGDDPAGSFVSLTVTKNSDGSYQYSDDGGAIYNGHLCGDKFKYNGGVSGDYTESGTMIVDGKSATKTSNWLTVSGNAVGGSCSDVLQKI
jgi:hypothetical protein